MCELLLSFAHVVISNMFLISVKVGDLVVAAGDFLLFMFLTYSDDLLLLILPHRGNVTDVETVVVQLVVACLCSVLHKALVKLRSFLAASYPY